MPVRNSIELVWRRSSFCIPSDCIEVTSYRGQILIRDSAASTSPILSFPSHAWQVFIERTATSLQPHQSHGEYL
jgi:hypothetical protein